MDSLRNRMHRPVRAALAAACATLAFGVAAGPAGADVSTFDEGDDGWRSVGADCSLLDGGDLLCDASAERTADGGNPDGALRSRTSVLANAAGLFRADHVWRGPTFKVDSAPGQASFGYHRRFDAGHLVALGSGSEVSAVLVNENTDEETLLVEDSLGPDDSQYDRRRVGIVQDALEKGDRYHVEVAVTTRSSSTQAEVLGNSDVYLDNVRVSLGNGDGSGEGDGGDGGDGSDGGDGNGGGGSDGDGSSPGVTEPQPPASEEESGVISDETRPGALEGSGPGGSAIDREDCTIVGTEGNDRIVGTKKHDVICALGGNDRIVGKAGHDVVDTGDGNDRANGGKKGDVLLGLAGRDRLSGGIGSDKIGGGAGRDILKGGKHNDNLSAADNTADRVNGGSGKRNRARTDGADKVKKVQRKKG